MITVVGGAVSAFAASPRLSNITPRGIQRGAEHTLEFHGDNLGDIEEVLFYEPSSFEVLKIEPDPKAPKVSLRVAAECRLGEHVAQIRTRSGISDYRTFYVEALPEVVEQEPNSEFDSPQTIEMNVVVNGSVANEDVDYYAVTVEKGARLSVEVVAMRLGNAMFDPYVAILDEKRFELAASDDTAFALQDACASIIVPESGRYVIEVRESAYAQGNAYRLHVGNFPRPTAVYPAGGKAGEPTEVRFLGVPDAELKAAISAAADPAGETAIFAEDSGGIAPTGNVFRTFEHGNGFEQEPNDEHGAATPIEFPLALNGIIEKPGDIDYFRFQAKKGERFEVECYARRIRSGLDPVMNLYKADGTGVAGNDDARGSDSYFRWDVAEDGEYVLRITDHLGRGGPDLVYRVEFQAVKPALTLGIPRTERYGQYRQQIYVPRGGRFGTVINAARANFGGELVLKGDNLPAGITMIAEPMPTNLGEMPVVFEASAEAAIDGQLVDFIARHADETQNVQGGFRNRADFVVAEPGQSLYSWKDVDKLAVAVVEELPFSIEIVEPKAPIVRDGTMQLKIVAHKKEGWDEAINVQFPFRPPGIGAASSVNIEKGQTEVLYPLNANGNAEIKQWKVFALATSGGMWCSSQLANLEVSDAFARFEIQRAACEQGQVTQVLCKVNQNIAFEGKAVAELLGTPPNVTVEKMELDAATEELVFQVKTSGESPVGKHNLVCQLVVTKNGEPVVSTAGSVELQIDQPVAPPPSQPMPEAEKVAETPPPQQPEAPKEKPLTRLQKLRLAAEQRKAEQ
jgi:hypothetical protein